MLFLALKPYVLLIFLFSLISCGDSSEFYIDDPWPGIKEFKIQDVSKSLTESKNFKLNSYFLISGLSENMQLELQASCYKRTSVLSKKKVYKKTVYYTNEGKRALPSLPLANHLPETLLIYPNHFEKCDFRASVKNSFGSTDQKNLKGFNFEYKDSSHELKLKTSKSISKKRPNLFESHSLPQAVYKSTLPMGEASKRQLALDKPQLLCYSNSLKKLDLTEFLDPPDQTEKPYTNRITISKTKLKLHPETKTNPIENCIFTALNQDGRLITSKTFDFIRSYEKIKNSLNFLNLRVIDELTEKPLKYHYSVKKRNTFIRGNNNVDLELPNVLLQVDYENISNEELRLHFKELEALNNTDVFSFNMKKTSYHESSDELLVEKHCKGSYPIYMYEHYRLERHPIAVKLYWKSSKQNDIKANKILTIAPKSTGTLSLYIEYNSSDIDSLLLTHKGGLVIAPNKNLNVFKSSFVSPNDFKLNALKYSTIDKLFSFSKKLTSLPNTFRAPIDIKLFEESLFDIAMVNTDIYKNGLIEPVKRKSDYEKNKVLLECQSYYQKLLNPKPFNFKNREH